MSATLCASPATALGPEFGVRSALADLADLVRPLFARREPRETAMRYVSGLLEPMQTANCWRIANAMGDDSPWRIQRLLSRTCWDAEAARGVVRSYITRTIGDPGALLVLREIGVVKKGSGSVAVARQYSESLRRLQNCQVSVCASYLSPHGHATVDQELYLPPEWTNDPARCRRAGIPEHRLVRRSKSELAADMVHRLVAGGLPASWVWIDEALEGDSTLSSALEAEQLSYTLAMRPGHPAADPHRRAWAECPAPPGDRRGAWLYTRSAPADGGFENFVVSCLPGGGGRFGCYRARVREGTPRAEIARIIGLRKAAEPSLLAAQRQTGLDRYEVRTWLAWYRHATLAMMAHSVLAANSARSLRGEMPVQERKVSDGTVADEISVLHGCQPGRVQAYPESMHSDSWSQ